MMDSLPVLGLLELRLHCAVDLRHLLVYPFFEPLGLLGDDESHASPRFKRYGPYYL